MRILKLAFLGLIALSIGYHGSLPVAAQTSTISGTWTANDKFDWDDKDDKDGRDDDDNAKMGKDAAKAALKGIRESQAGKIHLNFTRRTERDGMNNYGSSFDIADLQGLSQDQINGANSSVSFRLVRDAGTIECRGVFTNGRGTGEFTFTPNQSFVSGMRDRGYPNLNNDRLFASANLNLTLAFVDELKSANFGDLGFDDLIKARIFNITPQFMAEMKATGFPNLGMEDLVKARIFKIDADFVRQVTDMGFGKDSDSLEGLVKLRIFKVTPEFLRDLKAAGFSNLTSEQAVSMQIFKVTPEFINQMKAEGLTNLSVEDAKKLRIFKIDPEFVRSARAQNPNVTVEDLVRMKIHVPNVRVDM
jgi:hypothetical protein